MHLEECCKVGHNGVAYAHEVLATLLEWTEQQQKPPSDNVKIICGDLFFKIQEDLEFFNIQFRQLQINIHEDLEMLRQHVQLAQDLILFRLTILAAIFLPLSFATSFFGMNLDTGAVVCLGGFQPAFLVP